jgi:hypothetical protein
MPSRKQALKPLYLISKRKINALSSAHLQMEYRKHHWKKKIIDCNQQNENRLGSRAFVKYICRAQWDQNHYVSRPIWIFIPHYKKQEYLKKVVWIFLRHSQLFCFRTKLFRKQSIFKKSFKTQISSGRVPDPIWNLKHRLSKTIALIPNWLYSILPIIRTVQLST